MWFFSLFTTPRTVDADAELRAELREFAYDGLSQLKLDLLASNVKHGTWDGCVLSYRLGGPGSVSCDRKGRRGNAFTRYWDTEHVSPMFVVQLIDEEMKARMLRQAPAGVPVVANGQPL